MRFLYQIKASIYVRFISEPNTKSIDFILLRILAVLHYIMPAVSAKCLILQFIYTA